ncbi:MAG TPA: hypothetical protein VFW44_06705 [Bryobacteraceae bacterium]|nr:hypothetical protein [Bryobacteraceae bacterium]
MMSARAQEEEFRVYTDHPRLILTQQRLRLLNRERERQSPRWKQFDLLVKSGAALPEPGFAYALYYAVSGDAAIGKRAVDWALSPAGSDLRQLALVYDWCQPILTAQQSTAFGAKIRELGQKNTVPRDRIFALIATADDSKHPEEAALKALVRDWWRGGFARSLADGNNVLPLSDSYALIEMMHAIRDNLRIDLRDNAVDYFAHLPDYLVAGNYPASYRAPQNDFRIPMGDSGNGEPDLTRAALARAAGLAMVAFDNNYIENQYLQGWLIQDRFSMMTLFGAPYEFLWANPYQPGLSYFHLPLLFHDAHSGILFVRSSWDDDADWFGLYAGSAELFHDGRVTTVNKGASGSAKPEPLQLGDSSVVFGRIPFQFDMQGGTVLAIGLKPDKKYLVEADDEEMREVSTDRAGTFLLQYPEGRAAGMRVHE